MNREDALKQRELALAELVAALNERKSEELRKLFEVHPLVKQIIDRDCHVSLSHMAVIRHVISKLKHGFKTFRAMPKADRRLLMRQCIFQQTGNWRLYAYVMRGMPILEAEQDSIPEKFSGKELSALMRLHKKTISKLSFKLGVSAKRVRQVREHGLSDPLAVRDWYQAITGEDPGPIPSKYRISHRTEEAQCGYCGYPLYVGDDAFEYVNEVFCTRTCCRKSRGWS